MAWLDEPTPAMAWRQGGQAVTLTSLSASAVAERVLLFLQHIVKCHGSTLLPQFLGMYRVSVDNEETYLLVMRNMFSHRLVVHRKYDLKVRGHPYILSESGVAWTCL